MIKYLSLFFISFLFAYNGGLLILLLPPDASIHTYQLIIAIIGALLSFSLNESYERIKINEYPLLIILSFILFFQYNQSILAPEYASYKISLMWWNFAATILFLVAIKNIDDFRNIIIFGVSQIIIGIFVEGIDISIYDRFGAGEPIAVGRMGGILLCFALFFNEKKINLLRYFSGIVGFIVIILSGTRTIFISIAIIIFLMLFFDPSSTERRIFNTKFISKLVGVIFGIGIIIIALQYNIFGFDTMLIDRFFSTFSTQSNFGEQDVSTMERLFQWIVAFETWIMEPIKGVGFGGYAFALFGIDIRMYPHNILLELLSEGGIVGLLFFSGLIILIWNKLKLNLPKTPPYINKFLLSLLILGLLTSLTSLDIPNQFVLFLSINLILSLNSINELCKK